MSSRIHPTSLSGNTNTIIETSPEKTNVHSSSSQSTERNPMIQPTVVLPPQNLLYDPRLQMNPPQNVYPQPVPYTTVQITVQQQPPYQNQPAQVLPYTPNPNDKPQDTPQDKPHESVNMDALMAVSYNNTNNPDQSRTFHMPEGNHGDGSGGKHHLRKFVLMQKGTTCCCGIFSIRLGIIGNIYRLFVAIVTLPFTIIAFLFTLISKMCQGCFKCMKKAACKPTEDDDVYQCCYLCLLTSQQVDACGFCCRVCDPERMAKCCTGASECVADSCENGTDSCASCFSVMGGGCGKCCEFFGNGVCGGLGFCQGLISSCLECGKENYAGCFGHCGSLISKCCGLGVEYADKCRDSAGGCYGVCLQCDCDWSLCGSIKDCLCSCGDVNCSGCGDCLGDCCSGSATQFLECFQGACCNLIEVLGGILSSLGGILEAIWDLIK